MVLLGILHGVSWNVSVTTGTLEVLLNHEKKGNTLQMVKQNRKEHFMELVHYFGTAYLRSSFT